MNYTRRLIARFHGVRSGAKGRAKRGIDDVTVIPTHMAAFVLTGHGDMDELIYHTDWPVPKTSRHEVLIKVMACGLNNTDVKTRTAWYSKGVALDGAETEDVVWGGTSIAFPHNQIAMTSAGKRDAVAGQIFPELINTLVRGGRYVASGAMAGPIVDLDIRTLYLRDLTMFDSNVVPVGTFESVIKYIENGEIKPLLVQTFPLKNLHAAQTAFIKKAHVGNIVISLEP